MIEILDSGISNIIMGEDIQIERVYLENDLVWEYEEPVTDTTDFLFGYRLYTNGTTRTGNSNSNVVSRFFEVVGGHVIKYRIGQNSYRYFSQYDSSQTYVTQESNKSQPRTITLNSKTAYVRFSSLQTSLDNCYVYDVTDSEWIWKGKNVKKPT